MYTINYLLYFVLNMSLALLFKINNSDYYNEYVPRVVHGYAAKLGDIPYQATSEKLLLISLDLIPIKKCEIMHHRNMERFVCISSKVKDVGKGDSGGPLVCLTTTDPNEQPGRGILVGIVSGHRYGASSFFTRVSFYYKYIQTNKSQKNILKY